MAIFHLHGQIIKRSDGRSVVNAAAYRAGEALYDRRLKKEFDYRRKGDVEESVILAPDGAPAWIFNREQLWNAVEEAERRLNSQLGREFDVAISIELVRKSPTAAKTLVKQWATCMFVEHGLIVDISFHGFGGPNPHAHVLATLRRLHPQALEFDEGSPFVFESHKVRYLNDHAYMELWRKCWADMSNAAMAAEGIDARIDHRTLIEQGITNRKPGIHVGPDNNSLVARGLDSIRWVENETIWFINEEPFWEDNRRWLADAEARIAEERVSEGQKFASDHPSISGISRSELHDATYLLMRDEICWPDGSRTLISDVEADGRRREDEREESERLEGELDAARAIVARADELAEMGLRLNEAMRAGLRKSRVRLNETGPRLSRLIDDFYQRLDKAFGAAKTLFDSAASQITGAPSAALDDPGSRLAKAREAAQARAQAAAEREDLAAKAERDRQEGVEEFTKAIEDELAYQRLPIKFADGGPVIDIASLPEERRMFADVFSARLQPWVSEIVAATREEVTEYAWANIDDVQEIRGGKTCWNEHVFPPALQRRALQLLTEDPVLAGLSDQLRAFRMMGIGTRSAATVREAAGATAEKSITPRSAGLDREEDAAVGYQHEPSPRNSRSANELSVAAQKAWLAGKGHGNRGPGGN